MEVDGHDYAIDEYSKVRPARDSECYWAHHGGMYTFTITKEPEGSNDKFNFEPFNALLQ